MSPCQKAFLLIINVFIVGLISSGLWLDCGLGSCNSTFVFRQATGFKSNKDSMQDEIFTGLTGDETPRAIVCPSRKYPQTGCNTNESSLIPNVRSWSTLRDLTNATYSDFVIVHEKPVYFVCDQLEILIQARDGHGRLKEYGGDYFRAKIFTQNSEYSASSATDGEVIDQGNGTYSAFFTLKWAGEINVTVTLVHPSEAVDVIRRFRDAAPARYVYRGKFVTANGSQEEETFCNIEIPVNQSELCNLTDKTTGSPWYCHKPKSPVLDCSDWREHRADTGTTYKTEASLLSANDRMTLIPKKDLVTKMQIDVHEQTNNSSVSISAMKNRNIPICTPGSHIGNLLNSGYYSNDIWYNPPCRILAFQLDKMRKCVSGKRLHFLGDSTIRQLFEFYLEKLGPGLHKTPPGPEPKWHVGPTRAIDQVLDISMTFRFHAFPIGRNAWAVVKDIHYIANELDSIVGDDNSVAVISLWAHFTQQPEWFFTQLLRSIMSAIARLHKRSPSTLVVFKGANTREHANSYQRLYHSDWLARRMEYIILREIESNQNLAFMNAWSMSGSQLIADNVHPGGAHVENLSHQLLTFMCGEK